MATDLSAEPNGSLTLAAEPSARLPTPLTSFVGREREMEELLAQWNLPQTRLLTLTGPGGIGKTRLAIAAARSIERAGTQVVFVPLASMHDADLVEPSIGAAFGVGGSEEQSLAVRLAAVLLDSRVLLVVDNFEHVVDAAPVITSLLEACPALKVLTTSRRLLHLSGEIEYVVPPLFAPGPDASPEAIQSSASYRLFVARPPTGAVGAGSTPPPAHTAAIGEICRRLDGLPLAIELAAARARVLPPAELLSRLDRRFALLTGGPVDAPVRLRSMRDAIEWSYDLLSGDEQRLLRTLSVFDGGFTLHAVEAVAPRDLERPALDVLIELIDHSLVKRMETEAGTARFTMLETIREFALDRLKALDEEPSARQLHLLWMVDFLGAPTPDRFDERRGPADAALYDELNNLRQALSWAIDNHDAPRAAQVAWGMQQIWWHYGLTADGLKSVRRIADQPDGLDPLVHATVVDWVASFAHQQGDDELGQSAAATAVEMFKALGYAPGVNFNLWTLAQSTMWVDPPTAIEVFDEAVQFGRDLSDPRMLACHLLGHSWALVASGDPEQALRDLDEALPLYESVDDQDESRYEYLLALCHVAWAAGLTGNVDRAKKHATKALSISQEFGTGAGIFHANRALAELERTQALYPEASERLRLCLQTAYREERLSMQVFVIIQIAMLAQAAGDWHRAARLFGYAEAFWSSHNYAESTRSMATWGFTTKPTREALGDDVFTGTFDNGRRLSSSAAYEEAASFTIPDQVSSVRPSLLSRRETEVLVHLAQGQTNQEIANDLFLGKSTVDTHVRNILAKLGVESRRAAVRVARDRGLIPG